MKLTVFFLGFILLILACGDLSVAVETARWEEEIRFFEERDREEPPPKGGVLFIGSSSIRFWDLKKHFPGLPVINRGFGGSEISDSIYYADRILLPHRPKTVVFYAGDNDVSRGKSPELVFEDFKTFAGIVLDRLPESRLLYISIKPSLARWSLVDKMREANRLIEEYAAEEDQIVYIDIDAPSIGQDGKPRPELLLEDGLHLTEKGYELWSERVREHLSE